jgi:hypothetical protein
MYMYALFCMQFKMVRVFKQVNERSTCFAAKLPSKGKFIYVHLLKNATQKCVLIRDFVNNEDILISAREFEFMIRAIKDDDDMRLNEVNRCFTVSNYTRSANGPYINISIIYNKAHSSIDINEDDANFIVNIYNDIIIHLY